MKLPHLLVTRISMLAVIPAALAAMALPFILKPSVLLPPPKPHNPMPPGSVSRAPSWPPTVSKPKPIADFTEPCTIDLPAAKIPRGWNVAFDDSLCLAFAYPPAWELMTQEREGNFSAAIGLKAGEFSNISISLGYKVNGLKRDDDEVVRLGDFTFFDRGEIYFFDATHGGFRHSLEYVTNTAERTIMTGFGSLGEEYAWAKKDYLKILSTFEAR